MELKTRYQYTYFIYPYIVQEKEYSKYLLKILKNKNFKLRIFQKEKDHDIYTYFLPKVKDYMFSSFHYETPNIRMLEESKNEVKATSLSKEPCTIFEYNLTRDIQGKIQENDGIFFRIIKLELICFNTGICFLCMKTCIEDLEEFSNILNFNYKFRDINKDDKLSGYDKIRIQTSAFKNVHTFREFLQDITGTNYDAYKLNLNKERFLTYSYLCIDQEAWNNGTDFKEIQENFTKFINILPNDNNVTHGEEKATIVSKWKYAKIGITKQGVALFCSSADINNYTRLPEEFETTYLYTYIFTIYKKIYLKKISERFQRGHFVEFTKKLWVQEITSDNMGTTFYLGLKEALELEELYYKIKYKYDILFKEVNIENEKIIKGLLIIALLLSIGLNIMTFLAILKSM